MLWLARFWMLSLAYGPSQSQVPQFKLKPISGSTFDVFSWRLSTTWSKILMSLDPVPSLLSPMSQRWSSLRSRYSHSGRHRVDTRASRSGNRALKAERIERLEKERAFKDLMGEGMVGTAYWAPGSQVYRKLNWVNLERHVQRVRSRFFTEDDEFGQVP